VALLATVGVVLVAAVVAIGMHYALSCVPWRSTRCAPFSRGARLKVENRQQHVLFWGGLRGPLALALALALADICPVITSSSR
jgi:CPA1 family monovalent cation:H+ antiporter